MPWTHLKFLTELVYNLIFSGQTTVHLSTIEELDDRLIGSTRLFSPFTSVNEAQLEEEIDLDCDTGRAAYLESKAPTPQWRQTNLGRSSLMDSNMHYCQLLTDTANIGIANIPMKWMMHRGQKIAKWKGIGRMCGDAWFATSIYLQDSISQRVNV